MFVASCCGGYFPPDPSPLLMWMWVGRLLAALLLAEAVAAFVVGRHRTHRWRLWEQKLVVWLGALAMLSASFGQYAAAQYQQLAGMGATDPLGCPTYDCSQAVLASLAGPALLGIVVLAVGAGTLALGLAHLAAEA